MSSVSEQKHPWPSADDTIGDGRRQRSGRSRRKIIQALFDLLREGNINPTAAMVAARADVGLRTVFRHFEDMDSIFEELTEAFKSITQPMISAPFQSTHWCDLLMESVERKAELYELVFPMQVGLSVRRFESEFLQRHYELEVDMVRSSLIAILPDEIVQDRTLFAAIEVSQTFATWRRMREDKGLSVNDATDTVKRTVRSLIADVELD